MSNEKETKSGDFRVKTPFDLKTATKEVKETKPAAAAEVPPKTEDKPKAGESVTAEVDKKSTNESKEQSKDNGPSTGESGKGTTNVDAGKTGNGATSKPSDVTGSGSGKKPSTEGKTGSTEKGKTDKA